MSLPVEPWFTEGSGQFEFFLKKEEKTAAYDFASEQLKTAIYT